MKKVFSAAVALLFVSSVSFAQDAKQAPQANKKALHTNSTLKAKKAVPASANVKKTATATK